MLTGRRAVAHLLAALPKSRSALVYAETQHAGQRRAVDGAPFIFHPLEVATLLYHAGAADDVIAAGILHDVLEKTPANAQDLRARFGSRITGIVLAVSEDKSVRGTERRKLELRARVAAAGEEALMVFAADKISKVRELMLSYERRPASTPRPRSLTHYRHCLRLLEQRLADSPLVAQLKTELDKLPNPGRSHPLLAGAST